MLVTATIDVGDLRKRMDLRARQLPFATSLAINNTLKIARLAAVERVEIDLDRPTTFTKRAPLVKFSTKANLEGDTYLKNEAPSGTPPVKYLAPQVRGGPRRFKRFERALRSAGVLGPREFTVPGSGAKLNAFGNMSAGQITKILSALRASPDPLQNITGSARSRKRRAGRGIFATRSGSHLPLGVFERSGAFGAVVKPLLIFVDQPRYVKRYKFVETVRAVYVRDYPAQFRLAIRQALATAR